MTNLYRGLSIDVSYQVSNHLAKRFQRRRFFTNQPIRNKNCLQWPCLLLNWDRIEQSLQRTFHICFPTMFRFIWPSCFRGKDFQKSTKQKQELPVAAMFVIELERNDPFLQRTFHRSFLPSFRSFGHAVTEEKIYQKSTNQKQELPVAVMFVNGSGRNELFFL